jgi:predicted MFS family arabinose efflux permease
MRAWGPPGVATQRRWRRSPGRSWGPGFSRAGRRSRARALIGFSAFGALWGAWGAELPAIQSHAGVNDAELGLALLCIGAGAIVAMRPTGVLVDRSRLVLPAGCSLLGVAAIGPAVATSALGLALSLAVLGACSGAVDVAINAEAADAESDGEPLMNLAHAAFSASVVASSLVVGLMRELGAAPLLVLGSLGACLVGVAVLLLALGGDELVGRPRVSRSWLLRIPRPLVVLGVLAAIAYVVENAWQSWSAVQLEDTLDASAGVAALGPAIFAGAAALGRSTGHLLTRRLPDRAILALGASIGAGGTLLGALAPAPVLALLGVGLAGLGTSVCAPTLFSLAGRSARPETRASAVSAVTTLAYLGFVVGPAFVGLAAEATSLRAALGGVALLAAVLAFASRFAPVPERVFVR